MATKNLSRTVLENGNTGEYRRARHRTNRELRARTRAYLMLVTEDAAAYDEVLEPLRDKNFTWNGERHTDKLAATKRFLAKRVGRPWGMVRGELKRRFDARTLAGYRVLYGHLIEDVEWNTANRFDNDRPCTYDRFYVDAQGILCKSPKVARYRPGVEYYANWSLKDARDVWLAGRRVIRRNKKFFWGIPTVDPHNPDRTTCYRQDSELTAEEYAFFRKMPRHLQKECIVQLAS